ncbi:hypothetical protein QJQ45_013699 [Haematococcus lacustris]|nr:hypothetical protein QJQ45_013699 [Haematococcus lacustris]
MPHLKQLDRSATLAFCPEKLPGNVPTLIAAGTVAGAVDMTFSTNSVLEICSLDFANGSELPSVVGSVQAPDRFNRLAWGQRLSSDASFPSMGLLAGGLADGSVCLWDPALIASKSDGRQPLLAKMQKHTGAVKGLEFNTFSPNLLASGAADSDLCIWDLAKPATPSLYPALKGSSANGPGLASNEITFIAWNRKVQHILASSSTNGTTVVWDLKRQKPVISFRDPNSQRRASVLQWNPEVATQLVVASDDDRSPTLQMWDLRNSVSPLKEFVGHTKGVLGMAWSPHDSSLLLSSAKDNRNICWDVHSTDILCELPPSNNWNFDVQWCPTIPGVFSTSSFDGHVAVHSLHACTLPKITERVNADLSVTHQASGETVPLKKAPVWMKRPCGATFGFGGRLVTFANHRVTAMDASGQQVQRDQGFVTLSQVVTERELVARSEAFEAAIAGGDKTTLLSYCEVKAKAGKAADVSSMQPGASGSQEDGETWAFLSLLFENDARRELLRQLGFQDMLAAAEQAAAAAAVQAACASDEAAGAHAGANGSAAGVAAGMGALNLAGSSTTSPTRLHGASGTDGGSATSFFAGQDDDPDFFDKLPDEGLMPNGTSAPATPLRRSAGGADTAHAGTKPAAAGESERGSGAGALMPQLSSLPDMSMEMEDEIQRALIAGNYETAVESCFKANRLADALLIANIFNSSDLYKRTMHRYMKRCPKPFMQIVRANVEGDFEALVRSRPVGQWRETLALLATYTQQEDWTRLCDLLASRLSLAGQHHAASLCYICAGNVEAVVAYWARSLAAAASRSNTDSSAASRAAAATASQAQLEELQGCIEKAVVMGLATGNKKASGALADLVTRYASTLAAQGCMATALDYLDYVPGEASTAVAVLKDRIYRSGTAASTGVVAQGNAGSYRGHPPPFPFIQEEVRPAAAPAAQQPAKVAAPAPAAPAAAPAASAFGGYASGYGHASSHQPQPAQPAYHAAATGTQYGQHQSMYSASTPQQPQQTVYGSEYSSQPAYPASSYGQPAPQPAVPSQPVYATQPAYGTSSHPPPAAPSYSPAPSSSYAAAYTGSQFAPTTTAAASSFAAQQQHTNPPTSQPPQQPAPPAQAPSNYNTSTYASNSGQQYHSAAPPPPQHNPYHAPAQAAAPSYSEPTAPVYQVNRAPAASTPAATPASGYGAQPQPSSGLAPTSSYGASPAQPQQPAPQPSQQPQPTYFMPTNTPASNMPQQLQGTGSAGGAALGGQGMAPPAPTSQRAAPPAAPTGPPPNITVATADTSAVPAEQRGAVTSLTNLFNSCMPLATNPAKKREMDDNSKKLGQLFWRLNAGDVSAGVLPKLLQLCQAIDAAEWHTANHIQPTKGKGKPQGKAAKGKPAPQPGRWLDRDCNAALNMQRIGKSRWRPLELCWWPEQGKLPAKGKEYPGLGYK